MQLNHSIAFSGKVTQTPHTRARVQVFSHSCCESVNGDLVFLYNFWVFAKGLAIKRIQD